MAKISSTTFSNAFSWIKISIQISLKCVSNWQHCSIGSDNGMTSNRRQIITCTNGVLGCRCIYASLGLNELCNAGFSTEQAKYNALYEIKIGMFNNVYYGRSVREWRFKSQRVVYHCFTLNISQLSVKISIWFHEIHKYVTDMYLDLGAD